MIPDLGVGGAEKVLVNLVNNIDKTKFDVTLLTLFDQGPNKNNIKNDVSYKYVFKKRFKGSTHVFKLFSPRFLFKRFIKDKYDIIISYLEGPTARIVSGCCDESTKLVSWIHAGQMSKEDAIAPFRSFKEAKKCYECYDITVSVSQGCAENFISIFKIKQPITVLYNTIESEQIETLGKEDISNKSFESDCIKVCGIGKISPNKGFDRLARIHKKLLLEGINQHVYILGIGPQQAEIEEYLRENGLQDSFTFLGYQQNLYKYVSKCDLFVCASFAEGFSTAATEALILGVPVVTTLVSGMKEMLGENNEFGIITNNDEDALYDGVKSILTTPGLLEHYKKQAKLRGKSFSTEKTTAAVEEMLESL